MWLSISPLCPKDTHLGMTSETNQTTRMLQIPYKILTEHSMSAIRSTPLRVLKRCFIVSTVKRRKLNWTLEGRRQRGFLGVRGGIQLNEPGRPNLDRISGTRLSTQSSVLTYFGFKEHVRGNAEWTTSESEPAQSTHPTILAPSSCRQNTMKRPSTTSVDPSPPPGPPPPPPPPPHKPLSKPAGQMTCDDRSKQSVTD